MSHNENLDTLRMHINVSSLELNSLLKSPCFVGNRIIPVGCLGDPVVPGIEPGPTCKVCASAF